MEKSRSTTSRVQLGAFWLDYRADRDDWNICWYDAASRTRRRRTTGIGAGGQPQTPPEAAREALARHYLEASKPVEPAKKADAPVADLFRRWLRDHVATRAAPDRYAISVEHWLRFFDRERKLGRIVSGATVADVNKVSVERFIAWRKAEGVSGATISRDLAALRGCLNWSWREELIEAAPFVRDIDPRDQSKPRDLVYTMEQLAGLLEASWSRPDRHHVFLYSLIALSTCGRGEAILDLDASQIDRGLIHFLAQDARQTSKRRSIVPVAPTLAPWLEGLSGKVIKYRAATARAKWTDPNVPEYFEKDCFDLGNSFDACLIDAGVSRPVVSEAGLPLMLPPRRKLGESEARPKLRGIGTPNTLRHTIITEMHARGVDERQIDLAAGHAPTGTGKRNYMHLRPDYLAGLVSAVEDFWADMKRYTTVHLRTQCGPKIVSFAVAKARSAAISC